MGTQNFLGHNRTCIVRFNYEIRVHAHHTQTFLLQSYAIRHYIAQVYSTVIRWSNSITVKCLECANNSWFSNLTSPSPTLSISVYSSPWVLCVHGSLSWQFHAPSMSLSIPPSLSLSLRVPSSSSFFFYIVHFVYSSLSLCLSVCMSIGLSLCVFLATIMFVATVFAMDWVICVSHMF